MSAAAITAINLESLIKQRSRPRYSICTLVNRPSEYREMLASFVSHGFTEADCEFIYADNSSHNVHDGFSGYNAFLSEARGKYLIICHQDVLLLEDDRPILDARLAELTAVDPCWATCGNAGCAPSGNRVIRITDPWGKDTRRGSFPSEVVGLDENFVVVRREANLGVSPFLNGFHFYASELCASAANLGMKNYVIDFHLHHKSGGKVDDSFLQSRRKLIKLRSRQMRPKILAASQAESAVFLSGIPLLDQIGNRLLNSRFRTAVFRLTQALNRLG